MPELPWLFWRFDFTSLVDIVVVAIIIYWVLALVRGTRATRLILGIVILVVITGVLSTRPEFVALNFLLDRSIQVLLLSIPIIFQPELRRALEQVGQTGAALRVQLTSGFGHTPMEAVIDEVSRAAVQLARQRYGALVVLERDTGLAEFVGRATRLDAAVSRQLLITVFFPNTPLHDGAVIIRGGRIAAAAAVLPLSELELGAGLGTRHRAAVGISEVSDAVAVVVSEETGAISVAAGGELRHNVTQDRLRLLLQSMFRVETAPTKIDVSPEGPGGPGGVRVQ